jgi:hypothetical protein
LPKYNSIETIPARIFFLILKTKDYQQLKPKPSEKGLEELFTQIYDDFFIKSDNPESKAYLDAYKEIAFLEYKIAALKQALYFYFNNRTTEQMRLDFIEAVKQGFNIEINKDIPFIEEVERVLTIEIGIIQNDLIAAKMDYDNLSKSAGGKEFDYYDRISNLSNVLENNGLLKEDMSLATYISLEKLAKKLIEKQNKNAK